MENDYAKTISFLINIWGVWEALYGKNPIVHDKHKHVMRMLEIAKDYNTNIEPELMEILILLHDIGRIRQFQSLEEFNDRVEDHRDLAADVIESLIKQGDIVLSDDNIKLVKAVSAFHGKANFPQDFSPEIINAIYAVSTIDDIDNSILGAPLDYIERECQGVGKDYLQRCIQMGRDPKSVRSQIIASYVARKKVDKMERVDWKGHEDTLVGSPADYLTFAIQIMLQLTETLPKEKLSTLYAAVNGHGIIDRYHELIDKFVAPELADGMKRFLSAHFDIVREQVGVNPNQDKIAKSIARRDEIGEALVETAKGIEEPRDDR